MVMLWSVLGVAFGATGLTWNWGSEATVRYHMEAVIDTPRGTTWLAETGAHARAVRGTVVLDVSCQASALGSRWDVGCSLDSVALHGVAFPGEEVRLREILDVGEGHLQGKSVHFRMGEQGRIQRFDLRGADTRNSQHAAILDGLRFVLRRAFTPLDIQLPKRGEDRGKKWTQKGSPLIFELKTSQGTAGGVALKHEVEGEAQAQAKVRIRTVGRASLTEGVNLEAGTSSMIRVHAEGRSQFDTQVGLLDWGEVSTRSGYSVSNMAGLSHKKPPSFSAWVGRVSADGSRLEPQP